MAHFKATQPPAPYRFCWWCSKQLYCGGRLYTQLICRGSAVYVHRGCEKNARDTLAKLSFGAEVTYGAKHKPRKRTKGPTRNG